MFWKGWIKYKRPEPPKEVIQVGNVFWQRPLGADFVPEREPSIGLTIVKPNEEELHQETATLWFTESEFESFLIRALAYLYWIPPSKVDTTGAEDRDRQELAAQLLARWKNSQDIHAQYWESQRKDQPNAPDPTPTKVPGVRKKRRTDENDYLPGV
jgi:hypothetical protein